MPPARRTHTTFVFAKGETSAKLRFSGMPRQTRTSAFYFPKRRQTAMPMPQTAGSLTPDFQRFDFGKTFVAAHFPA